VYHHLYQQIITRDRHKALVPALRSHAIPPSTAPRLKDQTAWLSLHDFRPFHPATFLRHCMVFRRASKLLEVSTIIPGDSLSLYQQPTLRVDIHTRLGVYLDRNGSFFHHLSSSSFPDGISGRGAGSGRSGSCRRSTFLRQKRNHTNLQKTGLGFLRLHFLAADAACPLLF